MRTNEAALTGKVFLSIAMSLDGYIAGSNDGPENPLGDGGDRIHQWIYDTFSWRELQGLSGGEINKDSEVIDESIQSVGAEIMGKRMFNNGENYWEENPPFRHPVFILTHHARETEVKEGGTKYIFFTDGIERALEQAKAAAGDKDVKISGGAHVVQQYIKAGLLDEIQVHLVPVFLGDGIRLFDQLGSEQIELERIRVIESPDVTHLKFRVIK